MEACSGAHHWARELRERGFVVKLIAPQFVTPMERSMVSTADRKEDRLSRWVNELKARSHPNVAACALANKTVRIAWAMLTNGTDYEPELAAT